jgi:HSP20 family protein
MFRKIPFNFKNNAEKGRDTVEKIVDTLLSQSITEPMHRMNGALSPFRIDVIDMDDRYEIQAELPGLAKEDIKISYSEEKYLTIRAERPEPDENPKYICRERRTGSQERSFFVDDIDWEQTNASLREGILHIVLKKLHDEKGEKTITID